MRALERRAHGARVSMLAALLATAVAAASPVVIAHAQSAPAPAELRERTLRGLTAAIDGRVYLERPRPDAPDEPLAGVSIMLVPSSPALRERLEGIKRRSRESMQGFRDAAPAVRELLERYEDQLWAAGYPDAVVRTGTNAAGTFRAEVPAGPWLLVASRRVFLPLDRNARETPERTATSLDPLARYAASQYQHFLPTARMTGFDAVSMWLRDVDAEPGQRLELELHDRGVWLSGVEEETGIARRPKFGGGGFRRE